MPKRDTIVVGASAGGVDALKKLASGLPDDLAAAVFVVTHLSPTGGSFLPKILSDVGPLPAVEPADGDRIESGHIYLARPDYHLLIADDHIHLTRSPKEGHHRPSVNVTFRSAALCCGPRVIGVVLSGTLDDGSAGLWEIKAHHGLAVVQDPQDALFPGMPENAIQQVAVDFSVSAAEMPELLARLSAGEEVEDHRRPPERRAGLGYVGFTCPECRGPLSETRREPLEFRCRVGHTFSLRMLLEDAASARERGLYASLVALEEGADIAEFAATRLGEPKREKLMEKAQDLRRHARTVRQILKEMPQITVD